MVPPAVPLALLATLVSCRLALAATGVGTVTVPGGVGSGVVLVPAAVFVTTPVLAVTVALTTMVRVWPSARLLVVMRLVEASTSTTAPLLELAPMRLRPALSTSVIVTFWAVLGPRLTSVTV
jgi:hypothetical protein